MKKTFCKKILSVCTLLLVLSACNQSTSNNSSDDDSNGASVVTEDTIPSEASETYAYQFITAICDRISECVNEDDSEVLSVSGSYSSSSHTNFITVGHSSQVSFDEQDCIDALLDSTAIPEDMDLLGTEAQTVTDLIELELDGELSGYWWGASIVREPSQVSCEDIAEVYNENDADNYDNIDGNTFGAYCMYACGMGAE